MDILSFFGSVWLAIIAGFFIIAMVVGCTFDRRQNESPKWWIFFIGLAAYTIYSWSTGYRFSWESFWAADLWRAIGIYLAIGLGYSVLEFLLDVRRSVRYWKAKWTAHRAYQDGKSKKLGWQPEDEKVMVKVSRPDPTDIATDFVSTASRSTGRIIGVAINPDAKGSDDLIVPKIDRGELAEHIGAWTIFWPFYAVSLIIGDLVMEISRVLAGVFAKIAGRFVRMSFSNVFKF